MQKGVWRILWLPPPPFNKKLQVAMKLKNWIQYNIKNTSVLIIKRKMHFQKSFLLYKK